MSRSLFVWGLSLLVAVGVVAGLADVADAHAHIGMSNPAEGAVISILPETVSLTFTEPVEVRSSMFKVYPLDADGIDNLLQLNARARSLFERVLPLRRDEADRVDAGIVPGRATADEVQIVLQGDLPAGTYVVMWRVLSIDTHVTSGFYVFTFAPGSGN